MTAARSTWQSYVKLWCILSLNQGNALLQIGRLMRYWEVLQDDEPLVVGLPDPAAGRKERYSDITNSSTASWEQTTRIQMDSAMLLGLRSCLPIDWSWRIGVWTLMPVYFMSPSIIVFGLGFSMIIISIYCVGSRKQRKYIYLMKASNYSRVASRIDYPEPPPNPLVRPASRLQLQHRQCLTSPLHS